MPLTPPPPLETPRLRVRVFQESDLADLAVVNGDDETTRFLPYATWQTPEDAQAWHHRIRAMVLAGTGVQMVLEERASGRVIGACVVFRHEEASARAELGYVLGRAQWGLGFMHEALTPVITHAYEAWQLRRLEAEVNPRNLPSVGLLRKLGFTCEGRLRQRWAAKGQIYDTNIYGLLRGEWRPCVFSTPAESGPP